MYVDITNLFLWGIPGSLKFVTAPHGLGTFLSCTSFWTVSQSKVDTPRFLQTRSTWKWLSMTSSSVTQGRESLVEVGIGNRLTVTRKSTSLDATFSTFLPRDWVSETTSGTETVFLFFDCGGSSASTGALFVFFSPSSVVKRLMKRLYSRTLRYGITSRKTHQCRMSPGQLTGLKLNTEAFWPRLCDTSQNHYMFMFSFGSNIWMK